MSDKILTDSGVSRLSTNVKGYINKRVAELTESEYDALPIATKMNGTLYFVKWDPLPSWSSATDEEIEDIIDGYYNGTITLNEIKNSWSVGDTRNVTLSAMSADGVGESHRSQTVQLQILDFDHDDLVTAINGKTKSLITVDTKNCLRDATHSDTDGSSNEENGYMKPGSVATNVGGWTSSERRIWCNNVLYDSIPSYLKSRVKTVKKLTSAGGMSSTIVTDNDKVFLLSEEEVLGRNDKYGGFPGEGTQYALYRDIPLRRNKLPAYNNTYLSHAYWFRSPGATASTGFVTRYASVYGTAAFPSDSSAPKVSWATDCGIAPAFCL